MPLAKHLVMLGLLLGAGPAFAAGNPGVRVRVFNMAGVPDDVLVRAQGITTRIFRPAGIEMAWIFCVPAGGKHVYAPGCYDQPGPRDLLVRLLPAVSIRFAGRKGVSGAAWMADGRFSTRADIYYDRVEQTTFDKLRSATRGIFAMQLAPEVCTSLTLGMAMAHEMGHLLLGTNSHSKDGIMRPRWSRADLEDAYFGRLGFTPGEVKRLRVAIEARFLADQGSVEDHRLLAVDQNPVLGPPPHRP